MTSARAASSAEDAATRAEKACPSPHQAWQTVPGASGFEVLWLQGTEGETSAANRGLISNRLVVRERPSQPGAAPRVWLLGSGPSPAAGRALACQLQARQGWQVTDLIAPWARPELVLGGTAFPQARVWAHADVAAMMQASCPHCVARMRPRLGEAVGDLGEDDAAIRVPQQTLQGERGQLGPFDWWRLWRAEGVAVTVWQLRGTGLWWAPGLLWAEGPPDLRDADIGRFTQATARVSELAAGASSARWLPEQGPWLDAAGVRAHAAYMAALRQAVLAAQAAGQLETQAPAPLPNLPGWMAQGNRPGLNWQRAWRLLEDEQWATPAGSPASAP